MSHICLHIINIHSTKWENTINTNPKAKGKAKETANGNGRVRQNRTLREIVKRDHVNGNRWWKKLEMN